MGGSSTDTDNGMTLGDEPSTNDSGIEVAVVDTVEVVELSVKTLLTSKIYTAVEGGHPDTVTIDVKDEFSSDSVVQIPERVLIVPGTPAGSSEVYYAGSRSVTLTRGDSMGNAVALNPIYTNNGAAISPAGVYDLRPGLTGIVENAGLPVGGAWVQLRPASYEPSPPVEPAPYAAVSDQRGVFYAPVTEPGTWLAMARAPGGEVLFTDTVRVSDTAAVRFKRFRTAEAIGFSGTLSLQSGFNPDSTLVFLRGTDVFAYADTRGAYDLGMAPADPLLVGVKLPPARLVRQEDLPTKRDSYVYVAIVSTPDSLDGAGLDDGGTRIVLEATCTPQDNSDSSSAVGKQPEYIPGTTLSKRGNEPSVPAEGPVDILVKDVGLEACATP